MKTPHEDFERDAKMDGLGLAVFAILGALLDEVAATHPDGLDAVRRIRSVAIDMVTSVATNIPGLPGAAVRTEALAAVGSVFAGTAIGREVGGADDWDEPGPGPG